MTIPHEEDRTQMFVPLTDGTVVSHFRLNKRIGTGGMGEVYLADDEQLDRKVALKFLATQFANDPDLKSRFLREARASAKLNHPNIVTIHEVGEFNGRPYFAMEFVDGKSLQTHTIDQPLAISHVVELGAQIAEGLKRAHEQNIIHRDIKAANIIVGVDGRARILDFGLAAITGGEKLTRDGSTLGTVSYMSPEQVRGLAVDQRSDLFSLGIVIYELIAGRTPFRRDNDAATMHAITTESAEPLARYKSNVPPVLQQLMDKALQKDPATRYQTAADLIADLKRIQQEISTPSVSSISSSKPIIAVLPFDNTGAEEREYFADGITDEVIARLVGLKDIGVIAQSSAKEYKKSSKRPREIGQELSCGFLLQGSIRWDESSQPVRVRISTKLTRIQDETYLWAETYDRVLDQIFVVQSEIADHVAKALGVTFTSGRQADAGAGGTKNLEAYDLYLRAREYFPGTIEPENIRQAGNLLRQALTLDPKFAVAMSLLGWSEVAHYWMADRVGTHLNTAREVLEQAFAIAPGLFEAHVSMGYYHYWGKLDYTAALAEFDKAMTLRPNDSDVLFAIGVVKRRQGKLDESIRNLDLALRLNPRGQLIMWNQAQSYTLARRYQEAVEMADRAIALRPEVPLSWEVKALAAACLNGSFKAAAPVYEAAAKYHHPSRLIFSFLSVFNYLAYHGNDADKALDSLEFFYEGLDILSFLHARLIMAQLAQRPQMVRAYAEALIAAAEHRLTSQPEDYHAMAVAALAYVQLGFPDKARTRAESLVKTKSFTSDAVDRAICLLYLVAIYARTGDIERGLDYLQDERGALSGLAPGMMAELPFAKAYADNPRFWKILGIEPRAIN